MRIAYPYPTYWPYVRRGVERCIHDFSNYLVKQGHEVDIITTKPGRGRTSYDGGARVLYIPQYSNPLAYNYLRFIRLHAFGVSATRLIMKGNYDVAHLWAYSTILAAPLLSSHGNLPYLFHLMLRKHMWPGRVEEWFFGHLMRSAGRIAALTDGGAAEISAEHDVDVMTISPPVDTSSFRPSEPADLSRPRVLFTGDLGDARKGGPLLLRAWDEIHRRCPEAVLVLAGPFGIVGYDTKFDVYTLERLDLIRSPAARAAVEVPGPGAVGDLPRQYSRAAVTVLPSVEEAFGIVVTESLACGTPVVCSAYDGPGEIVTNPEVGVTVPLKTLADLMSERAAQQLADAVVKAIELARQPATGARCQEWADQWSLDTIGPRLESILTEIADTRGRVSDQQFAGVS